MAVLSELRAEPLDANIPSTWDQFVYCVQHYPDQIAVACTHQEPDLYGIPTIPLDDPRYHEKPYLRWTYKDLREAVDRFATALESRGAKPGSSQLMFMPNVVEFLVARWATVKSGIVDVPINPRNLSNKEEVIHMINTAKLATSEELVVLAYDQDIADQVDKLGVIGPGAIKIIVNGKPASGDWISFESLMEQPASSRNKNALQNGDVIKPVARRILFTSGTTSLPKGCLSLPDDLSLLPCQFGDIFPTADRFSVHGLAVPNNHAINYIICSWAHCTGATVVIPGAAFNPSMFVKACDLESITWAGMVPTMLHAIGAVVAARGSGLKTMQTIALGGAMVSPKVLELGLQLGAKRVCSVFGMTELVIMGARENSDISAHVNGNDVTVGQPCRGHSIKICAPDSRKPLPRNQYGEVHFTGQQLIHGYIGKTSDDFYEENGARWFRTGDQGYMDDQGRVFVCGRYKEMIIRGGENISPAAIEAKLHESPKIRQLNPQILGIADPIAGEVPVAVVLGNPGPDLVKEIVNTILESMGNLYVPDEIIPISALGVDDYPTTMSGKVKKRELTLLVRNYRQKADAAPIINGCHGDALQEVAKRVWARAIGLSEDQIDVDEPVADFADSITIMRVRDKIQRETGKNIPLQEMVEAQTIAQQIKLLRAQDAPSQKRQRGLSIRKTPLSTNDMIHTMQDHEVFSRTKKVVEKQLQKYGLAWGDVTEVIPAYDYGVVNAQIGLYDSSNFKIVVLPSRMMSPAALRTAIKAKLRNNPLLASFLVWDRDVLGWERRLHVVVRQTEKFLDQCIGDYGKIRTVDDLKALALKYPYPEHASLPGPLYRALIVEVEELQSAAFIFNINHAIMDASYIHLMGEDLDQALGGSQLHPHIDYKIWADSYFSLRTSLGAKVETQWHASRLRDLAVYRQAMFPPMKPPAVGFVSHEIAKGGDGLQYQFDAPGFNAVRKVHRTITQPVILKTATALLNTVMTGHTHALFSNIEAARTTFPFIPKAVHTLGDFEATDVAGPCCEAVINLVEIRPHERVIDFINRMQEEQNDLTANASAPWLEIMKALGPEAGAMMPEIYRTQSFNWVPGMGTTGTNPYQNYEIVVAAARPEMGLVIMCGMGGAEGSTVFLHLRGTWVDGNREEAKAFVEQLEKITRWITREENWESEVGRFVDCLE